MTKKAIKMDYFDPILKDEAKVDFHLLDLQETYEVPS